jgi:anti-sigma factor RsiW
MSTFTCDDKQTLIAYLYDELDAAARARVDAHLLVCTRCAAEMRALGHVRAELAEWAPPDAELGFAVVRKADRQESAQTVRRGVGWWDTVPLWARAAAAVLVLAAGAAIANIQVRSNADGVVVTTGWMAPVLSEPTGSSTGDRRVEAPAPEEWRTAVVALEQQLRSEIRSTRQQDTVRAAAPPVDEATIRRVQQLLAASEERQDRELALRFTQFAREMDMMRRADFQRITRGFGQFDEQMFRQQQMLNNVIRVSGMPQQ